MIGVTLSFFPLILVVLIFLNRYFLGLLVKGLKVSDEIEDARELPAITIILPLFNEGQSIYTTLVSLLNLDYPKDRLRILVADDASTDDSVAWVEKAMALCPAITLIQNPRNIGKRLAISQAVRLADSEFIVSVDSDVVVCPDAVHRLMAGFTHPRIAAVGGRVHVLNCHTNWLTKMQTIKYFIGYQYLKNLENAFSSVMCLSGCLTAYRRAVLIDLEPILLNRSLCDVPIKYGEDRFLTRQILKAGYRTKLVLDAQCYTKAPTTLSTYFSQQLRWRRSNIVDFIGGISHVWRLNTLVAIHYFAMQAVLLVYPVYLWLAFADGHLMEGITLHCGILAIYGLVYWYQSRNLDAAYRVHPLHALSLGLVLPLTYMVISILAALTLDAGSWETRGGVKERALAGV